MFCCRKPARLPGCFESGCASGIIDKLPRTGYYADAGEMAGKSDGECGVPRPQRPGGYFKTPAVDSLHAYPNLLRLALAEKYTNAVINVIVTAIGGEASDRGAARFATDVLTHKPDVVLIDYALNDRRIGLEKAKVAWTAMIQKALAADVKVLLLTPTPDQSAKLNDPDDPLNQHAEQIRHLAAEYRVGLVDSLARFKAALAAGTPLANLMAQVNHPNAAGHRLVAEELVKWFPSTPADADEADADGRPSAKLRLDATDAGVVLRHGDGPNQCDYLGARDVWVWESGGTYFMHYDGAGTNGWLACLATSKDLTNWTKVGPVLQLGKANAGRFRVGFRMALHFSTARIGICFIWEHPTAHRPRIWSRRHPI